MFLFACVTAAVAALNPADAHAQSSRTTVLRNAPITSIALPGSSASVSVNTSKGSPPPGERTVVLRRPLTAISLPGWRAHINVASQ
ncbi:MAG: hypothetical protein JNL93_25865 [Pelomonas sp.]|nr:hypothetical protein [Roseateles sp.]